VLPGRAGAAAFRPTWRLPQQRSTSGERMLGIEASTMMNLLLWLVIGGVMGWLAAGVVSARAGTLLSIVVGMGGIVGALIAGFLLGSRTISQTALHLTALLVGFAGAVVLLAIVKLVRRGVR
jgi:uncharacterized membrane protein YeaQ/YmgE (transglycosylase-associated protein family)